MVKKKMMNNIMKVTTVFTLVGGIELAVVGVVDYDIIANVFGGLTKAVYTIVGVSGIFTTIKMLRK